MRRTDTFGRSPLFSSVAKMTTAAAPLGSDTISTKELTSDFYLDGLAGKDLTIKESAADFLVSSPAVTPSPQAVRSRRNCQG